MAFPSMAGERLRWTVWLLLWPLTASAWTQDLTFSAKVEKTSVEIGDPINLALTFNGDVSGVELSPPQFPEEFVVAGRSQSTNFSIRAGAMERSTSLTFVLIPQRAGTFQLGPFLIRRHKDEFKTEPIEVTVKKSVLPPQSQPQAERFTI